MPMKHFAVGVVIGGVASAITIFIGGNALDAGILAFLLLGIIGLFAPELVYGDNDDGMR